MTNKRNVTITDFLTLEEIIRAQDMWNANKTRYAARVCQDIIIPNMQRINTSLQQKNDPMYLAYAVEYVMTQIEAQNEKPQSHS